MELQKPSPSKYCVRVPRNAARHPAVYSGLLPREPVHSLTSKKLDLNDSASTVASNENLTRAGNTNKFNNRRKLLWADALAHMTMGPLMEETRASEPSKEEMWWNISRRVVTTETANEFDKFAANEEEPVVPIVHITGDVMDKQRRHQGAGADEQKSLTTLFQGIKLNTSGTTPAPPPTPTRVRVPDWERLKDSPLLSRVRARSSFNFPPPQLEPSRDSIECPAVAELAADVDIEKVNTPNVTLRHRRHSDC
ncbi:unnamed protein product, partial [Mesorhabditis spiculigera]